MHLIDVSSRALDLAAATLARFADVRVTTHEATYEAGLSATEAPAQGRQLVLFLGSNIGNFDPEEALGLLRQIAAALRSGDLVLLGADLVKPERDLLLGYDDPLGVTAAFNKNVLLRINTELGAEIDLRASRTRRGGTAPPHGSRCTWSAAAGRSLRSPVPGAASPSNAANRSGPRALTSSSRAGSSSSAHGPDSPCRNSGWTVRRDLR